MTFGEKLKDLRLHTAKLGIHAFADKIYMKVSDYLDIEQGYKAPPKCHLWLNNVFLAIDLEYHQAISLLCFWNQPFHMKEMKFQDCHLSPFTSKQDGSILTPEEKTDLETYINNIAIEHNKKAKEYNDQHKI